MTEWPKFREAVVGTTSSIGPQRLVYDYWKCVEILMRDGSYTDSLEAADDFEYNYCNVYQSETDPIILYPESFEEIEARELL